MDYFDEFEFKTPKQLRTKKAIDDIVESIEILSQSHDLKKISTRDLSKRSGYALGSIYAIFNKFDDIFIYVFLARRRKLISKLADFINNHPADQPLHVLVSILLNEFIDELSRPHRTTLLFVMSQFLKRTKNPQLINIEADWIIPLWINASLRDKTNTFYNFSENELKLKLRAVQSMVRSPFFEDIALAGTEEHKEIVFNHFMRLFIAPDLISHSSTYIHN